MRGLLRVLTVVALLLSALMVVPTAAADPGALDHFSVSSPGTQVAGVPFDVTVTALDSTDAPVVTYAGTPTVGGTFSSTHGTPNYGTLGGFTDGVATLTGIIDYTAESGVEVTVTDSPATGSTGTFDVGPNVAATISVETAGNGSGSVVAAQNVTAGDSVTGYAVTRDQYGNFVANVAADWSLVGETGGVTGSDLSGAHGASVIFTGHLVGAAEIEATSGGLIRTPSGLLTVVEGAATQIRVEDSSAGGLVISSQSLASDHSLTAYAISRDAEGNFLSNVDATWSLVNVTGGVTGTDLVPSGVTHGTSAVFTGHLLGSANIEADADSLTPTTSGTITVTAGTATAISVETASDGSGSVLGPQAVTAGSSVTGYAVTRDKYGNYVGNVDASWSLVSLTGGVTGTDLVPSGVTHGTSAVFTGRKVGSAAIRATSDTLTPIDSGTITVTHGAATQIWVETASNGTGSLFAPPDLVAGSSVTGYAISRDFYANFVANVDATWSLVGPAGGVTDTDLVPSSVTHGTSAVFTGHLVGSTKIEADSGSLAPTPSAPFAVIAGAATQIRVETLASGSGVVVPDRDLPLHETLTVYAISRDFYANFVANVSVTWTLVAKTGSVTNGDLAAAVDGMSATLTANRLGTARIEATGAFVGDSGTITITGIGAPDSPTGVVATGGRGAATITWTPPLSNGGSAITSFTTTAWLGGVQSGTCTGGPLATSCRISGLNNTLYSFTVVATNIYGDSLPSDPPAWATPAAPAAPTAPTGVTGVGFDGRAVVSWTAPSDDGGRAVSYYSVRTYRFTLPTTLALLSTTKCTTSLTCTILSLTNGTAYKFKVFATNTIGPSPDSAASAAVTPHVGATFVPLTPNRILDTAKSKQLSGPFQNNTGRKVQITGQFPGDTTRNVPATATSVTGVLSVENPTGAGFLSVLKYAINTPPPTSNLNFPAGDNRSAGLTIPLAPDGSVGISYSASSGVSGTHADVALDITGYFVTGTSAARYLPLTPNRILDSRTTVGGLSGGLTPGVHRGFKVTDFTTDWSKKVPSTAVAVVGTLTVIDETYPGYFTVGPDALDTPPTASLWFAKDPTDGRATTLTVKIGTGGMLYVTYTAAGAPPTAKADVLFDVLGYFQPGTGGYMYVPVTSARIFDTRPGKLTAHYAYTFPVRGRGGVASTAVAVTGTLTVTRQTSGGFFTLTNAYANTTPVLLRTRPSTSTMNFAKDNRATGVIVPLNSAGRLGICFWANVGNAAAAIFDVSGYFV